MIEEKESLYNIMLNALIRKYGLMLSSSQVAEALSISTRTLDERRKSGRAGFSGILPNAVSKKDRKEKRIENYRGRRRHLCI